MNSPPRHTLTYRDAGVDIERGNRLVERIKPLAASTRREGVLGEVGGFGGLFEIPRERYRRPVLVSATDGVGTKLRLAIDTDRHDGIGIDLVAMCANDVLTLGAEPLYFLDYFATGRLDEKVAVRVMESIAEGCRAAGAALIGGETAEMPGMYAEGDYDLAGFCVGVVEHDAIIDGRGVAPGDALLGIASSGPHANGYSLIRKTLELTGSSLDMPLEGSTLGAALLAPTRIYVRSVLALMESVPVKAMAHITGGGLTENIPRVLPAGTRAALHVSTWSQPAVFDWLARSAGLDEGELRRTFNCGVGLVICVDRSRVSDARRRLEEHGEVVWEVGSVEASDDTRPGVVYR